jgi:hypothetical protein
MGRMSGRSRWSSARTSMRTFAMRADSKRISKDGFILISLEDLTE